MWPSATAIIRYLTRSTCRSSLGEVVWRSSALPGSGNRCADPARSNQLESLSGGETLIDGKPTSRLSGSLAPLRSRVGFVFQQFNLYAHLTAQENIALALERVQWLGKSAAQARARGAAASGRTGRKSAADAGAALRRPAAAGGHRPRLASSPADYPCSMSPPRRSTRDDRRSAAGDENPSPTAGSPCWW